MVGILVSVAHIQIAANPFDESGLTSAVRPISEFESSAPDSSSALKRFTGSLALSSGDLDEDGVPDLICGLTGPGGGGLALYRGNVASIFPHAVEARQRRRLGGFPRAPFLSPVSVFPTAVRPDYIQTGDFDNDGHQDVALATHRGRELLIYAGDGSGALSLRHTVSLPGEVTMLLAADINRQDALLDLVVGLSGPAGPRVMILESENGASSADPRFVALPSEATDLVAARLDEDSWGDLAVAAGPNVLVIYGYDRDPVSASSSSLIELDSPVNSMAWGDFLDDGEGAHELAVQTLDGQVRFLTPDRLSRHPTSGEDLALHRFWIEIGAQRIVDPVTVVPAVAQSRDALLTGRISGRPTDDLVSVDALRGRIRLFSSTSHWKGGHDSHSAIIPAPSLTVVSEMIRGRPVAALTMRLNEDALTDLVFVGRESLEPFVVLTAPQATILVNSANDTQIPGDGECTLREAIVNANDNADSTAGDCAAGVASDMISFSIGGGGMTATILPTSELPIIADVLTLDGTTQGCVRPPCVEISGSLAPPDIACLVFGAGDSVVRGMVVNGYSRVGNATRGAVHITSSRNRVEGNFLGTDIEGLASAGHGLVGLMVENGSSNTVGGTVAAARNVISGNGRHGLVIYGESLTARSNQVLGNFIGTDLTGTAAVENAEEGVLILNASNNTIGSASGAGRNVISGNADRGVELTTGSTGNLVLGNYIGTDVSGTLALGNRGGGIFSKFGSGDQIGGTAAGAGNVVSANLWIGILISGGDRNIVQGNSVGTTADGSAPLGNARSGIFVESAFDTVVGGSSPGAGNVVSANVTSGIIIRELDPTGRNKIQGNLIGTDRSGSLDLGNNKRGVILNASDNTVGGTLAGEGNLIAFNGSEGIAVVTGHSNDIVGNSIHSNALLGIDLGNSDGPTPNDSGDADTGPNDLQNFPVLSSASPTSSGVEIGGSLNSVANRAYRIEFFADEACDGSGHGEGHRMLGFANVVTDFIGNVGFEVSLDTPVVDGEAIVATATLAQGSTSEFSACINVGCPALSVFGETVVAPDKMSLAWPTPQDAMFVRGDLDNVSTYSVEASGVLHGATMLDISADATNPSDQLYYLLKSADCGSWQTSPDGEPGRDTALP